MQITDQTVEKLAELSKLYFEGQKKEAIKDDLNKIIGFMEKLNEIDTDGIQPLIYINEDTNVTRRDDVAHTITREEALQNAPHHDDKYFKVPKFITHRS